MSQRIPFESFRRISGKDIMVDTDFHKWLKGNIPHASFIQAMKGYLDPLGFDIKLHTIPQEQVKRHRWIYENFSWKR